MKKALVLKNELGKPALVFNTLEEAATETGMSVSSLSRMLADDRNVSVRYMDRVYLIRLDREGWLAAVMNCRNTGYIVLDSQPERLVPRRTVKDVRDITASWHTI